LSGDAIPPACRILHIADAFDSMVSGRPYRRPMTGEQAIGELRRCAGTQFDSDCVEIFAEQVSIPEVA
jgi:HD-GYP domain-containing protein (c-di-GMP phosphodiesterase class II)